jgi:hypothetical protein
MTFIAVRNDDRAIITDTDIVIRGAAQPASITERRLDGRLLVAEPGKKYRWLVLDRTNVPAALVKRLPSHTKAVLERIVVPTEHLADVIALVEGWAAGGGAEKDVARAASAKKAAATRKAKADAAAAEARAAEAKRRQAVIDAETTARLSAWVAAWPALEAACIETAAQSRRLTFRKWTGPNPGGEFSISTPYDERIVSVLRGLPGARWERMSRCWIVPASTQPSVQAAVDRINALSDAADAAIAAAKRAEAEAQRARQAELDRRRFHVRYDRAPRPGAVVRNGGEAVCVEDLGRPFRAADDGLWNPEDEGQMFVYAYFRAATPEETAALEAGEAQAKADREVAQAASVILREPGEVIQVGSVPAGEVILDDHRGLSGTRDWCVLSEDGQWIWRCAYRGLDGDTWGQFALGYNTRGDRIPATRERVAAFRAEDARARRDK